MNPSNPTREAQRSRFELSIREILTSNRFYKTKLAPCGFSPACPATVDDLHRLPFTTKGDLVADQAAHPPYGSNLTYPIERYTRIHRTSGTSGSPIYWLDDPLSWQMMLDCWQETYRAAGVGPEDRVYVAFSFGPFVGFWVAFEAAQQLGALAIPGGGLGSVQRLHSMVAHEATVLACTPTYALRLAEAAREEGIDLARGPLRITIHGGEPGASLPNVRSRIEAAFGARCFDHTGATEVGPWGYACGVDLKLHINEREFVAEVIDPDSLEPVAPDAEGIEEGELVLTNLRRVGSPVIRYRTGDYVRLTRRPCTCGCGYAAALGGLLSRVDDMLIVRGVNIYPSAIENVVRAFREIGEFEIVASDEREMTELLLRVEVETGEPSEIADRLRQSFQEIFSLRPTIEVVETGSLPRYPLKAARLKRH